MNRLIYYRLVALWVLCEAMIGGIIHGLRLPVSGLIVGSCAVICICLIAYYNHTRGAILKATLIVAIFKMMLSPQAPPPAYIAVFFQGLIGEVLFWNRRFYPISCMVLAVIALIESSFQRIFVLTLVYGNDFWRSINEFMGGLIKQKQATNYSLFAGLGYLFLHLVAGVIVGKWAAALPGKIIKWKDQHENILTSFQTPAGKTPSSKKKRWMKRGLFITWIALILLYIQSQFSIGAPILSTNIVSRILIRSIIIVCAWYFVAGPLLKMLLHSWLRKKQVSAQSDIQKVLALLPSTRQLINASWERSRDKQGLSRLNKLGKLVIVNALSGDAVRDDPHTIYILCGPIGSGKTTALRRWIEKTKDVEGILTPVVDGSRMFMDAKSGTQWPMEVSGSEERVLSVGRFKFSHAGFEKAKRILHNSIAKPGWLVIDEIGPLELRGEGFCNVLKDVLKERKQKTILVVRDHNNVIMDVKRTFGLEETTVINSLQAIAEFNSPYRI